MYSLLVCVDALGLLVGGDGLGGLGAGECSTLGLCGAVNLLLEDWILIAGLELGLEVFKTGGVGGAIRAAAGVGHVETGVLNLLSVHTPSEGC